MKRMEVKPKIEEKILSYALFKAEMTKKIRKELLKRGLYYDDFFISDLTTDSVVKVLSDEMRRKRNKVKKEAKI
jgi:hypothetical protein